MASYRFGRSFIMLNMSKMSEMSNMECWKVSFRLGRSFIMEKTVSKVKKRINMTDLLAHIKNIAFYLVYICRR